MIKFILQNFLALLLLCQMAACTTTQSTHFYTLSAPVATGADQNYIEVHNANRIEVLPVHVPDRFRRPQLVIHAKNSTHVSMLEHERWISAFDEELTDALKGGIYLPQTNNKLHRYVVNVDLLQMTTVLNDAVSAHFQWTIKRLNSQAVDINAINLTCDFNAQHALDQGIDGAIKGNQAVVQALIAAINVQLQVMEDEVSPLVTACKA